MIDYARITVRAGSGGNGSGSFFRIKGKRYGKADGGDGGRGGDIYLLATRDLSTLESFRYVKDYKAKDGSSGQSQCRKGAGGADLVIRVPVGTMVKIGQSVSNTPGVSQAATLRTPGVRKTTEFYDLTDDGQKVLVARGGQGGKGNIHLRDEFGRRPRRGEKGRVGETGNLTLELKLIADVGLIGLPNAGKSTLLSVLTSARPAIAPYPFTTLEPNLGVLNSSQFTVRSSRTRQDPETSVNREPITVNQQAKLVIADIPGLIKGASQGRGLGDLFLRHIERTKILVHLIDVSTQTDKWQDYQTIRGELKAYSKELVKKKEIIALTKIDLIEGEKVNQILKFFKGKRKRVVAISAVSNQGLELLVGEVREVLKV